MKFLKEIWKGIRTPIKIIIQDFVLVIALLFAWFGIANIVKTLFPMENSIITYFEQASGFGSLAIYIIFLGISVIDYIKRG